MASEIIFSRSNTEKVTALLVPHCTFDALCEKRKLVWRWLLAHYFVLAGSADNLRSSLTNHLPLGLRPSVRSRPSILGDAPFEAHAIGPFRRDVALSAPTTAALKNVIHKTGALDFLAGKAHLGIAFDAKGIVGS
jgi:hypothetical protein